MVMLWKSNFIDSGMGIEFIE